MKPETRCVKCGWEGSESELAKTFDGIWDEVCVCPNCLTDKYLMDIE